jgi:uncharacterized protein YcsI (UPF0317 family)
MIAHEIATESLASPREVRLACREGRHRGTTRGLAFGYVQCNLVIIREKYAYEFLLYCQRNQRACPVLDVTDTGNPEPRQLAPGADLRTDLPRYAVYREGKRLADMTSISDLWEDDFVAFLIGSGISFDQALEQAGVRTTQDRWVLRSSLPTTPAGRFHGPMVVTMRWLSPDQAITATQVTARFPFNHGAPIHIGNPEAIGADLKQPYFGPPVEQIPASVVPVFWACGVTPQEAALAAKIDLMITHSPSHDFVTDLEARKLALP